MRQDEPFLQNGSDIEGIDDAIMDLIALAKIDQKLALEIADEISACLFDRKKIEETSY